MTQNSTVLDVLAENTAAIKSNLKHNVPKYTKTFPIKTVADFNRLEESINESNEKEYVSHAIGQVFYVVS